MITLREVRKSIKGRLIIAQASLSLEAGRLCCLSGPSGAGKTTLLEIMAGMQAADSGRVERGGPAALAFQDDLLLDWLDAAGNLEYALAAAPSAQRRERAREWLGRLGLPPGLRPGAMSGGMRRRLNLARAFALQRPLLLLDEPFAFLDLDWQRRVAALMAEAAGKGAAVFVVSHQMEALAGLDCLVLEAGELPLRLQGWIAP